MTFQLDQRLWFPDPNDAERGDYDGLLAVEGDLSVERLLLAYRSGIFPWSVDPITWWSPNPRGILELDAFHVSRSLRRVLNKRPFEITQNRAFRKVMTACATTPREGESWISAPFIDAYERLHQAGHAHSVECWQAGTLVGGIYGVAVGGLFAGESMFHLVSNASKVALCHLANRLKERRFALFDVQMVTPTTEQFGAIEIPRNEYLARLERAVSENVFF